METAYIGLGSNIGDRVRYLVDATDAFRELGNITAQSNVYETEPFGVPSPQNPYLNMVISLETVLVPGVLLHRLRLIETRLNRVRYGRNEPRTIDLDILFYGDQTIDSPALSIPHPRLHERAFVLVPLSEIAPDFWHPTLERSVRELGAEVPTQGVNRLGALAALDEMPRVASAA